MKITMDRSFNNKRIAKNTIALYVRMLFSVCINLYISRVILEVLGVDDFGIYNIVGGIVSMMAILNSSMSGATSRFLTFNMGLGDGGKLKEIFSSALQVHLIISIIVFLLGESVGLWFVNSHLVIASSRIFAANWVYQLSLLAMCFAVIQVPFSADIIARERMDVYAYIEILNAILKLVVVYILVFIDIDKLIGYSSLMAMVSLMVLLLYIYICKKKFPECCLEKSIHWETMKPIIKFCGLDLFGNGCVTISTQGRNVLINQFFGVIFNAASGVALQAGVAVSVFTNNAIQAFRPQIIKEYSNKNYIRMQNLISLSCKISILLTGIIIIPLFIRLDYIMLLWLKIVPQNAVLFCRLVLLGNALCIINSIIVIGIHATGNIKSLSFIGGIVFLAIIPCLYVGFTFGLPSEFAFQIVIIQWLLTIIVDLIILHKQIPEISVLTIIRQAVIPISICVVSYFILNTINSSVSNNLMGVIIITMINAIVMVVLTIVAIKEFRFTLTKYIRNTVCQK